MDEPLGLVVICDGMGGMAGGEVASHVAIESFLEVAKQEIEASRSADAERTKRALCRAAAAANRAVRARASYDTRFRGMGTTLVAARLDGNELTVVNVGDSRAYLVHGGAARQVTRDHSYVAEQMRMGLMTEREAERSPLQSAITRAIGIDDDVQPDFYAETVEAGDAFVVTAGCDKSFATCGAKFANADNHRGFPHMPGNDAVTSYPMQGDANMDGGSLFK